MNIEHIRDFLCVSSTLNLTMAADLRNTTQSNLSKRIRALEASLGKELIDRSSRPLSLTSDGERFVSGAQAILAELEAFQDQKSPWLVTEGAVRIAMPHSASVDVFPKLKVRLLEGFPSAHFATVIANHDMVATMLSRSECDLALVTRHYNTPQSEEFGVFRSVDIARDRLVVVQKTGCENANRPLYVSHRGTYLGQIWQNCRSDIAACHEVEVGMAADIRANCLAGRGKAVLPFSLIETDLAADRVSLCESPVDMNYTYSLFCAPKAGPLANNLWKFANEKMNLPAS